MLGRRLQILADGQEIDVGGAQIVHHLQDLLARLAQPDHQAGLGEHRGIDLLHPRQQAQRGEVARARPDRRIEPRHGLEIVVEDVGPRRDHGLDRARPCAGSRASAPRWWWSGADCVQRRRSPRRSALRRRRRRSSRSTEVTTTWPRPSLPTASAMLAGSCGSSAPGLPVATLQKAQARVQIVAQDHQGGVLLLPALADVGAGRLLAHRVEP